MNIARLSFQLEKSGLKLPEKIIKRDGAQVRFDINRIEKAIQGCFDDLSVKPEVTVKEITRSCATVIAKRYGGQENFPSVEQIQDLVEITLLTHNEVEAAQAYITYRDSHSKMRGESIPDHVRAAFELDKQYFKTPMQRFAFYDKYSRFDWDLGRRQTWPETVDRTIDHLKWEVYYHLEQEYSKKNNAVFMGYKGLSPIDMTASDYAELSYLQMPISDELWEELRQNILEMNIMPSMRLLAMAGPAVKRNSACLYNCSFLPLSDLNSLVEILQLSMSGCGVGYSVERHNIEQLPRVKRQSGAVLELFVVADSSEGWAEALRAGLIAWWSGTDINFDMSLVRPAGSMLKTKGGRASGPQPLIEMLAAIREIILSRQGQFVSSYNMHLMACWVGEAAVQGSTRRTALICLFDFDDVEMRNCKNGPWGTWPIVLQNSNNSAVWPEDISDMDITSQMLEMMKGCSGEPGIFSRVSARKTMPAQRSAKNQNTLWGVNPCVPGDTWVQTSEGPRRVRDLVGVPFTAVVDGKNYDLESVGFFPTGVKQLVKVVTADGRSMRLTADHKVLTERLTGRKLRNRLNYHGPRIPEKTQEWVPAGDLIAGQRIVLNKHTGLSWNGRGSGIEGYAIGNLIGDGTFSIIMGGERHLAHVQVHTTDNGAEKIKSELESLMYSMPHRSDYSGWHVTSDTWRTGTKAFTALASSYGVVWGNKTITDEIETASSDFSIGFLRGLFDADGHVEGNMEKSVSVRFSNSDKNLIEAVQRILTRLGIYSVIRAGQKAGSPIMGYFTNRDNWRLIISGEDAMEYMDRIGFWNTEKQQKWETLTENRMEIYRKQSPAIVVSVEQDDIESVYDVTVSDVHAFDANGYYVHNCGEILLKPYGLCNLSQAISRPGDTENDLKDKVRLATILGTIQSLSARFPGLRSEWKQNCEEERLLGVDLTAQHDCELLWASNKDGARLRRSLRDYAVEINEVFADVLGINPSASVTCNKPAGNSTVFIGSSVSGIHRAKGRVIIRRNTVGAHTPQFRVLKDSGAPMRPYAGFTPENATRWWVEFVQKSPKGAPLASEATAIEQCEFWLLNKMNWTTHNPSCTVNYRLHEMLPLIQWLCKYKDVIGGLSFLPVSNVTYPIMPIEEITEAEYDRRVAEFPEVDYALMYLYEREDMSEAAQTLSCFAGNCDIE